MNKSQSYGMRWPHALEYFVLILNEGVQVYSI